MREWRNWQTRTFEGRVVTPYGFKSRFSHQDTVILLGHRVFSFLVLTLALYHVIIVNRYVIYQFDYFLKETLWALFLLWQVYLHLH